MVKQNLVKQNFIDLCYNQKNMYMGKQLILYVVTKIIINKKNYTCV